MRLVKTKWLALLLVLLPAYALSADHGDKRIFYGDLHTHSNISADAILMQLAHGVERGPEAACLYALACAQVDFYGQSDHAEMMNRADWQRSVDAVEACNEMGKNHATATGEPGIVAFQGFEWTSSAKGKYWGHKNVFFRNDAVPEMPIAAYSIGEIGAANVSTLLKALAIYERTGVTFGRGYRASKRSININGRMRCGDGASPDNCIRVADEPKDLWRILNSYFEDPSYARQGYDAMVIPHGTSWGMGKLGTDWDIQLNAEQHDTNLQRLIEVYSGHGNSEEYRDFDHDENYESCNERAAKLQVLHCRKQGIDRESCRPLIEQAYRNSRVEFTTEPRDWGLCSQCTDCFKPAERYYPKGSVQAALAKSNLENPDQPQRYHFGFIAATDDHASRPASVKETRALADWGLPAFFQATIGTPFAPKGRNAVEAERVASFFYPGGLVAVHAETRSRNSIWRALKRREVYGTSGPRISLWFHAKQRGKNVAMGARITAATSPEFTVEAWGGPVDRPGCSWRDQDRWGKEVVENICLNACYNPGSQRVAIERLEIIKITPQLNESEHLSALIQDPYLVLENDQPSARFKTTFADPQFAADGRDSVYYVRAVQTPTPAVNGQPMRHVDGRVEACPIDYKGNDCKAMAAERAWSSPIYVDFAP